MEYLNSKPKCLKVNHVAVNANQRGRQSSLKHGCMMKKTSFLKNGDRICQKNWAG